MRTRVKRTCLLAWLTGRFRDRPVRFRTRPRPADHPCRATAGPAPDGGRRRAPGGSRTTWGSRLRAYDPQLEDLNIAQARASYVPSISSTLQSSSRTQPNQNFLAGAVTASDDTFVSNNGIAASLPWGGSYDIGLDSSRFQSNNFSSTYNPQLRSSLSVRVTQPLMRNFKIDGIRQQLQVSQKNREIADVQLRESLTALSRNVRNAYWNLAYQIASLAVARQSLELAQESLRNTRSRIEIGTTPPIDEIADQAEVAQRQEAVIVAEAQIATSEDTLRALIYNPNESGFLVDPHPARSTAAVRAGRRRSRARHPPGARSPLRSGAGRESRWRSATSTCGFNAIRRCRMSRRYSTTVLPASAACRSSAAPVRSGRARAIRSAPPSAASDRCWATCSRTTIRAGRRRSTSAIRSAAASRKRRSPARACCARRRRCSFGTRSCRWRPRCGSGRARRRPTSSASSRRASSRELAGAAARGRAAQIRRRHVDQLPRVPGAARPGAWPATTSCAPSSTTTSRWSISRPSGGAHPVRCRTARLRSVPRECSVAVTIITLNEAGAHRRSHRQRRLGRRGAGRRRRQHATTPSPSPAARAPGCRPGSGRVRRSEEPRRIARVARLDLSLDADERITPALAAEIRARLTEEPPLRGYRVPRVTFHLGRWIRTTDFYPDYQTRLYDRRAARWQGKYVHESVTVDGGVVGQLTQRAAALLVPRSSRPPRSDQPLHVAGRAADARERAARRDARPAAPPPGGVPPELRAAPRFHRRHGRADALARQRLFGAAEVRQALGAATGNSRLPNSNAQSMNAPDSATSGVGNWRLGVEACSPCTSTRRRPGGAARTRCGTPCWACARSATGPRSWRTRKASCCGGCPRGST